MRLYRRSRRNDLATIKLTRNRWAVMQNVPRAQMEVLKSGRRIMNRRISGVARPRIAWAMADKIPYTVTIMVSSSPGLSLIYKMNLATEKTLTSEKGFKQRRCHTHTLWFQKEALRIERGRERSSKGNVGITACIQVLNRTENFLLLGGRNFEIANRPTDF